MEAPLLGVQGLNVDLALQSGRTRPILRDISFELPAKRTLGLIGASGAGKTVLAKALVNWIEQPLHITGGTIAWRGKDLLGDRQGFGRLRGSKIAYVGGNPAGTLDPTQTVGAQIVEKLLSVQPRTSRREAIEKAVDLLAAVRIPSPSQRFHEYPYQYSGGMMQRALIVDALISDPELLVADNVTQPLDVTVAAQILKLMRELTERFATAVVFVSSSLPVVADIADELLVLHEGRIVERQATRRLVSHPIHAYTQALIGELPTIWQGHGPAERPRGQTTEPLLSVSEVSKTYKVRKRDSFAGYNHVQAVRRANFDIFKGDNFGVVGESGCGKSSLMRLLTRLEPPDTGRIVFDGQDLATCGGSALQKLRRRLQLVLQDPFSSLPPRSPIGAIIEEPLRIHGLGGAKERRRQVRDVMGEVGLDATLIDELPAGLSAGQRQRVNVARAMILEPALLIMDETLSSLDQTEQTKLLNLFERLQAQHGFTYLFISHDLAMVRRVCSRIAVMYLGEIVELAANERLFFDPGHPYTKALLSAVPTLEERRYRPEDCLLEGEPPSPIDLPPGCSFASRCPSAFDRCRSQHPGLTARSSHDLAACFLVEPPRVAARETAGA
ncbi:peptide/nickel transport system ATP-binding protein [Arboricoccus pini]|uniref:Peptide/nickel transport system ATP-binding protein n=1 Tax=Arboricoccus pini TaxID=1963835 RepID=A0A212RKC1_9PROT|nr:ABC transporter ATP-binding protein [Arboricoccus pini]SNB72907.1 peptide/nickel transport system ATP-binding protein [Arboricoccus pini]